jgi:hypothetical protein
MRSILFAAAAAATILAGVGLASGQSQEPGGQRGQAGKSLPGDEEKTFQAPPRGQTGRTTTGESNEPGGQRGQAGTALPGDEEKTFQAPRR